MTEAYRIEEAARAKEAATGQLYRPEGRPVFGEQEHRERERARAALAGKDKPRMYVLQHVAAQRLNQNPDSDLGGELRDVAGELRAGLDPEAESRLEAARQAVQDAEDLRFKAQLARVGANNLGDAFFGGGGSGSYWSASA
jgi:hypothetical protein